MTFAALLRPAFIALVLAAAVSLPAQAAVEERILLKHLPPSKMMDRIHVLTGLPAQDTGRLRIVPEDASRTLVVQIPMDYGDHLERERLRLLLREYVARLDQPERTVELDLYLLHASQLTEAEYLAVDRQLRAKPLDLAKGTTFKGIVYAQEVTVPDLEILAIDESQAERRPAGVAPVDPVMAKGRLLPAVREDGRVAITVKLSATHTGGSFANNLSTVELGESAVPTVAAPMVVVGGQRIPLSKPEQDIYPGRHEVMFYIWAKPEKKTVKN